jgi:hypothetical protein
MNREYKDYLDSPEWKYIRRIVLRRDNKKCTKCGSDKNLRVHHTNYKHIFHEINYLIDLVTLCDNCHGAEHGVKDGKNVVVKKAKKRKDPYINKRSRPQISTRAVIYRATILSETNSEYKVRFCFNGIEWTLKKSYCKITKRTADNIFTIRFPLLVWKDIMRERRRKFNATKSKYVKN